MKAFKPALLFCFFALSLFLAACTPRPYLATRIPPPAPSNNPCKDVILTCKQPVLSFYNSTKGGWGRLHYTIQIDTSPAFDSDNLIEYTDIPETPFVTSKRVAEEDELDDRTVYYWRVRADDLRGKKSIWALSRFFLDTESDDEKADLIRTPIQQIRISDETSGAFITDTGETASQTCWIGSGDQETYRIRFDFGEPRKIRRIWELFQKTELTGRLRDYHWQYSETGETWESLEKTAVRNSDAFRRIVQFKEPVTARFFRLDIEGWYGDVPKIYDIMFFSEGTLPVPPVPENPYVLIVSNRHDGSTTGEIQKAVENADMGADMGLETLVVPYFAVSLDMIRQLEQKPVAIILSDHERAFENLPMFEFNGVFEIIRQCRIPTLGISGGHHLMAMSAGLSFARKMGYTADISEKKDLETTAPITVLKKGETVPTDPIFDTVPEKFYAVKKHNLEIVLLPETFEKLAESACVEVIKHKDRSMYGVQFHPEIASGINQGAALLSNFLDAACRSAQ